MPTRQKLLFPVLIALLGAFVALPYLRGFTTAAMDWREQGEQVDGGVADAPVDARSDGRSVSRPNRDAATRDASQPDARRQKVRPIRMTGLGWEALAPALLSNGAMRTADGSPFARAAMDVSISVAESVASIERALARGGEDPDGTDIAILPLPALVASYDRLRVLEPTAFFVTAWSRGRDLLAARSSSTVRALPNSQAQNLQLVGAAGDSSTFLGLYVLDLVGVRSERLRLVSPSVPDAASVPMVAVTRSGPSLDGDADRSLVSTTEATHLIPWVMVAPRSFIASNRQALVTLCRIWIEGDAALRADVPRAARRVATMPNAPEPAQLIEELGELEAATAVDNAHMLGLAGRGALTIETLLRTAWRLSRDAGFVRTPYPAVVPWSAEVVVDLARTDRALFTPREATASDQAIAAGATPLLVATLAPGGDEQALAADIGFIASVFSRSVIHVSGRGRLPTTVVEAVRERFGLGDRIQLGTRPMPGVAGLAVEVF